MFEFNPELIEGDDDNVDDDEETVVILRREEEVITILPSLIKFIYFRRMNQELLPLI